MATPGDTPPLIRPIPRRPFDLNLTSPTPPEDERSGPSTPFYGASQPFSPSAAAARLLDIRNSQQQHQEAGESLSRATSFLNLTASTLFGIYAPTASTPGRVLEDRDEPSTPWGTGAQTPARRPTIDDATYELMRERSKGSSGSPRRAGLTRRASSGRGRPSESALAIAASLGVRATLLFGLGMGYGLLVTHLRSGEQYDRVFPGSFAGSGGKDRPDAWYLWFWGVAGVFLGVLLPWFDGVWEDGFGRKGTMLSDRGASNGRKANVDTDWALVIRGIGAFVGIVFAIRKLSWTSTMQASLTLALTNPFLWYLIDRSKPGFILSSAVCLAGSAVLMALNANVMPAPTQFLTSHMGNMATPNTTTTTSSHRHVGFTSQATIETGVWMISVLFCSCVCFGNIGRRLALNRSATVRGRWGGVR